MQIISPDLYSPSSVVFSKGLHEVTISISLEAKDKLTINESLFFCISLICWVTLLMTTFSKSRFCPCRNNGGKLSEFEASIFIFTVVLAKLEYI